MQTFSGFEAQDFAAYAPGKWQSNAFNLERMRVKNKLSVLGQRLSPLQPSPDSPPLSCDVSAEHPALWNNNQVSVQSLYFTRSEEERKELYSRNTRTKSLSSLIADPSPFREHILLCVLVRESGVEVGLMIHPNATVDRENISRKLTDRWHLQSFVDVITNLPEEFAIGLTGESPKTPSALDGDAIRSLIGRFNAASAATNTTDAGVFSISKSYPSTDPSVGEPSFADRLRENLKALLPVYGQLAWSRQNDFVAVAEALREEKKTKQTRGLSRDDKIRVIRGLFTGKTGVILGLEAKGALKVRLGTMVVKIDAKDVVLDQ